MALKPSNSSPPSTSTEVSCATQSVHCVREVASVGAVTTLKFLAPASLVRITQRPPKWSASYSTSRARGASRVKACGSAAGA
ncbi:hypothetical protein D3C72_2133370 [compost metagenome]